MHRRRLALLLLLLVLVGGGLLFLWGSIGGSGPDESALVDATTSAPRSGEGAAGGEASPLEAPSEASPIARELPRSGLEAGAPEPAREENFALGDALWIEGSLRIPRDTPADDSLAVWVLGIPEGSPRSFEGTASDSGSVIASLRKKERGPRWARRAVDAQGKFRVPCPKDAAAALLLVDGRYLYSPEGKSVSKEKLTVPILLEPELGAFVRVRCIAPPGVDAGDTPVGARVDLRGFTSGGGPMRPGRTGFVQRALEVGPDSVFELRGLPPDLRYTLSVVPRRLATVRKSELSLAPGKELDLDLEFKRGARVSGRVLDEARAPVAGVKVSAEASRGMFNGARDDRSVTSATDGGYEIAGLRSGKQRLTAALEGWADGESTELDLSDGEALTAVDIVLPRGNRVSGRVTWPDGKPAADAQVQAADIDPSAQNRFRVARLAHNAKTDAQGAFAITGLTQGPFTVTASARRIETAPKTDAPEDSVPAASGAHAPSSAPDALASAPAERAQADPAPTVVTWVAEAEKVAAGTSDVNLVLRPPPGLSGRVVDASGSPLRTFTVDVTPDWQSRRRSVDRSAYSKTFQSEDGSFLYAEISDGDWKVAVKATGFAQAGELPTVGVPQTGQPLVIVLARAASIAGVVQDPTGAPIAGAEVRRSQQGAASPFSRGGFDNASATSDEQGAFAMPTVPAGAWELTAGAQGWARSDALPVQVVAGEKLEGLVVRLRNGGTLTGEVFDVNGARAAGRHVQAFSMNAGDNRQASVDERGTFKAEHLTPGTYQVMLEPSDAEQQSMSERSGKSGEPDIADVLSKLKMTSCEIKEGEVTHVVLGAPPKAPVKLSGRITQGGEPVTKCTLVILNEGGALLQSLKFGKVDGDGRYEVTIDKPGDVVLVVTKEFGRSKGVDFYLNVPEVEQYTIDLALPLSAIRGSVRDPSGAPLAKFPVQLTRDASGANIMMMDGPPSETTDANGRYEFKDLNPGTYAVAAGGTFGAYNGEDTKFGRSVRGGLRIEKDRVLDGIDLKLGAPGSITGTVRDSNGGPVAGATVYVRDAQGELLSRLSPCTSDAGGKFVYKGVSPGSYTLSAKTKTLAARDGAGVLVHEGESAESDVALEPGTMLRVSATDKDDKPLKAGISVKDERGFEVGNMLALDAMQEAFTLGVSSTEQKVGPLPAGKYVVTATAPDGRSAKKAVTLKGQDERKLIVRVE